MTTAKELLDRIDEIEKEISIAESERAQAFEELTRLHGKQFDVEGKTKLVVRRVSKGGPVRYHFRNLGRGAVKVNS